MLISQYRDPAPYESRKSVVSSHNASLECGISSTNTSTECGDTHRTTPSPSDGSHCDSDEDDQCGMVRMDSYYDVEIDDDDDRDDENDTANDDDSGLSSNMFTYERMGQGSAQPTATGQTMQGAKRAVSPLSQQQTLSVLVAKQRSEIDQAKREKLASWVEIMAVQRADVDSRAKACALLGCAAQYELKRYRSQEIQAKKVMMNGPDKEATLDSIRGHIRDTLISYKALMAEAKTVIGSRIPSTVFDREELLALNDSDFDAAIRSLHRQRQLSEGVAECDLKPFSATSSAIGTTTVPSTLLCSYDRELIRKELASLATQSVGMHAAVAPYTVGILVPTLSSQGLTVSAESDDPSAPFCYDLPSTQRTFFRNRKWIEQGETQKLIILSFASVTSLAQARQLKQVKRKSEIVAAANAELTQWKEERGLE